MIAWLLQVSKDVRIELRMVKDSEKFKRIEVRS
jgi:hypothetical protein